MPLRWYVSRSTLDVRSVPDVLWIRRIIKMSGKVVADRFGGDSCLEVLRGISTKKRRILSELFLDRGGMQKLAKLIAKLA